MRSLLASQHGTPNRSDPFYGMGVFCFALFCSRVLSFARWTRMAHSINCPVFETGWRLPESRERCKHKITLKLSEQINQYEEVSLD